MDSKAHNIGQALPQLTPYDRLGPITICRFINARRDHPDDPLFADPNIYCPIKKLGMFNVSYSRICPVQDKTSAFSSRASDFSVVLALPSRHGPADLGEVSASFSLIAQYIEAHNLAPTCIQGTTYEHLGRVASLRYGFTITKPRKGLIYLLEKQGARAGHRRGLSQNKIGRIVTVYQRTNDFLQRYGSKEPD